MNAVKISLITATFNSAATVKDTLQCVADQDYGDIEHLIIDGGSNDSTLKIAEGFSHIGKIISGKDRGIYDAMNKGINMATGEVIGILNSDDLYAHRGIIADIASLFENPKVQCSYADLQFVQRDNTSKIVRTWEAGAYNKKSFYYGWMPPHPTFFVRREVYDKVGLFNLDMGSAADYELMLRILLKYEIPATYIHQVMIKMRMGGVSTASLQNRIKANYRDRLAWKVNDLEPYFFTLYLKPLRKLGQFLKRG